MSHFTFIHCSDFHLGADIRRYGQAATVLAKAQFTALEKTFETAHLYNAAFILICGDFFDSRYPSKSVIDKTYRIIENNREIRVFILPGTHDFLSSDSIFSDSQGRPSNVIILNGNKSPLYLEETDTYLYFIPNRSNHSSISPIEGLTRIKESGTHIGLAHGSLKQGNLDVDYDFPINPYEIELGKLDYIAFGHWHRPSIYKFGQTVAAYPGIPQPLTFNDPDNGRINIVKVDGKGGVNVDNTTTSSVELKLIDDIIYHPYELEKVLDSQADPAKIIKLNLKYSDNFKEYPQIKRIIDQFRSRFLLVAEKENKITKSPAESAAIEESQPLPLIESYHVEIKKLRDEDSDERQGLYDRAKELGIKIIKGEI